MVTIGSVGFIEKVLFKVLLFFCCGIGVIIILNKERNDLAY